VDFVGKVQHLSDYFKCYKDFRSSKDFPVQKASALAIADLTKLAAENESGRLGLSAIDYSESPKGKTELRIGFDSEQASAIHIGAGLYLSDMGLKGLINRKNVVLQFHQINIGEFKSSGRTGDRAIVKSVQDKDLPVFFASQIDKDKMERLVVDSNINPLSVSFSADIFVETNSKEKPVAYRVINLHGPVE